jgi:NADH-quinone oxidoreductase subunit H
MVLALLVPVLLAGSMDMLTIVTAQSPIPFMLLAPVAMVVFFISSLGEVGRAPFDLLEAESEIVAGFHIEYSGLKFGMFFVAEFLHAFTISALTATLFLGGWQGPWAVQYPFLGLVYFLIKTSIVYFVVIWIRGSFPRIRIDQMNSFNWKFITPVALLGLAVSAVAEKLAVELSWSRLLVHLSASALVVLITVVALALYARATRRRSEEMPAAQTASESTAGA